MGQLVQLSDFRLQRRFREVVERPRPQLFVDLADPFSYLAAERVERTLPDVEWRLACQRALLRAEVANDDALFDAAERRAAELRLPLQWPDRFPSPVPAAMRAAAHAIEVGRGSEFIVAAGRLAFCGGFDLDDPEVLMEAAAAAGIALDDCLAAAGDASRDAPIEAAGRRLLALGADVLPALRVGHALVSGEAKISAYLLAGPPVWAIGRL
jgi:2-hydroxychromene-2-carboxylate isomerase